MKKQVCVSISGLVLLALCSSLVGVASAQSWSENFDSYATGSQMHDQGGWKGWDNDLAFGALTSDSQRRSTPNAVAIVGASDLVHEYSATSGQWVYTAWQYVPSDFQDLSYFLLLNTYTDRGPYNWSVQVSVNGLTNRVVDDFFGGTLPLIKGQWVELRVVIDLDSNTQTFYYGGEVLYAGGSWTPNGGVTSIAAVDLFANSSSVVYYDDMRLVNIEAVDIDIKPGDDPNSINVGSKGTVAVAILTTAVADGDAIDFDAATVDPSTVTLGDDDGNDTPVATRPNGSLMASLEDVDGDGDLDLVLHFDTEALVANGDLTVFTTELILNGETSDGQAIRGSDSVSIVPPATTTSFSNTASIAIPTSGVANPYPSDITVFGLRGIVVMVTVTLSNLSHTYPNDIDILLEGPGGQTLILMSDVGGGGDINNVTLTFDDAAAASLPSGPQIVSGTFRPTNISAGDPFPSPAPPPSGATTLATFNGTDPNGTWSLYVVDDVRGDVGSMAGGWSMTISTAD